MKHPQGKAIIGKCGLSQRDAVRKKSGGSGGRNANRGKKGPDRKGLGVRHWRVTAPSPDCGFSGEKCCLDGECRAWKGKHPHRRQNLLAGVLWDSLQKAVRLFSERLRSASAVRASVRRRLRPRDFRRGVRKSNQRRFPEPPSRQGAQPLSSGIDQISGRLQCCAVIFGHIEEVVAAENF